MTKEEFDRQNLEFHRKYLAERSEDVEKAFKKAVELAEQAQFAEFNPTDLLLGLVDRLLEEQGSPTSSCSNLTAEGVRARIQPGGQTWFIPSGADFNLPTR